MTEPPVDAWKLEALAQWFDCKYPNDVDPAVQRDLRRIAGTITKLGNTWVEAEA